MPEHAQIPATGIQNAGMAFSVAFNGFMRFPSAMGQLGVEALAS
jgi:hypothetical protein